MTDPVTSALSPAELERYARQLGPGVLSLEGQQRLKASTAFISRVGGMGGPAAMMLTMAGIGRLFLAHSGDLQLPDLNRQVLGSEAGLGKERAAHFSARLRGLNPHVEIEALSREPDDGEALELARRSDIVLACPPNFKERLRLNRAAIRAGVPFIDAAQWGLMGTLIVVRPGVTACLACLYPEPPPFEEEFPVVGAISSTIGSLAALEAIKILSGTGEPLWGQLLSYDGFRGRFTQISLQRRTGCPCCDSPPANAGRN